MQRFPHLNSIIRSNSMVYLKPLVLNRPWTVWNLISPTLMEKYSATILTQEGWPQKRFIHL